MTCCYNSLRQQDHCPHSHTLKLWSHKVRPYLRSVCLALIKPQQLECLFSHETASLSRGERSHVWIFSAHNSRTMRWQESNDFILISRKLISNEDKLLLCHICCHLVVITHILSFIHAHANVPIYFNPSRSGDDWKCIFLSFPVVKNQSGLRDDRWTTGWSHWLLPTMETLTCSRWPLRTCAAVANGGFQEELVHVTAAAEDRRSATMPGWRHAYFQQHFPCLFCLTRAFTNSLSSSGSLPWRLFRLILPVKSPHPHQAQVGPFGNPQLCVQKTDGHL